MAGRVRVGLQELQGMELDEDLALPLAPGVDVLTHRISLARLQHVSNLAWCLGSWLPHLVSLAVLLIRMVRVPFFLIHTYVYPLAAFRSFIIFSIQSSSSNLPGNVL